MSEIRLLEGNPAAKTFLRFRYGAFEFVKTARLGGRRRLGSTVLTLYPCK